MELGASDVGVVEPGVESYEFGECGVGSFVVGGFRLRYGHVEEQVTVVRKQLQRSRIVGYGGAVVADALAGHAAYFPCVGQEGVALDGECGVGNGAFEVVEVVFGKRPEQVWLGHVGLCADDLVEVLDREDIVLEVERVASYREHTVSVELAVCRQE